MKIIGIYSLKGGVGKTAAAVNLAYLSSDEGRKTLLWDMDAQGAATFYFQKKKKLETSAKKILSGKSDLIENVKKTDYPGLFIIPSDNSVRNLDLLLYESKAPEKKLDNLIQTLGKEFEIIILDSPPGMTLLSENIFYTADYLIIPTIPTPLSVRAYHQIYDFFEKNGLDKKKISIFFSMVETRKTLHRNTIKEFSIAEGKILETQIPYLSEIEKMGIRRRPVTYSRSKSRAVQSYISLWQEIEEKLLYK